MGLGLFTRSGIAMAIAAIGFSAQADIGNTLSDAIPEVRPVQSQEEYRPHVGILGGVSNPEGSYDAGGEYAIEAGYQPYVPFGLGVEIHQSRLGGSGGLDDFTRTGFLLKGSYHFGGNMVILKDAYLGLGVGALIEDFGPHNQTYGGLMPNIGVDIPTFQVNQQWVTLGANLRYLLTSSESAPDTLSLNGAVKYFF